MSVAQRTITDVRTLTAHELLDKLGIPVADLSKINLSVVHVGGEEDVLTIVTKMVTEI